LETTSHAHKLPVPDSIRLLWKPPPDISVPDWVEKHVRLTEKMSGIPGLLRISVTPYIRGPLEALGNLFIEEVVLVWGRQLSKSTGVQYSFLCYCIAQDPGSATFLLPIRDKALEVSETKLQPIFEACDEVRRRKPINPDSYTKSRMDFTTMVLAMGWGGSESQTTTRSNRYLFIDEADEIKKSVGQNAIDPIRGILQTTTTFPNRKVIMTSTPTTPEGNIWKGLKTCQYVFEYWIPCPHCGVFQILYWENVRFGENHDPIVVEEMAYYECEACHERISNLDKIRMLAKGEWRARTTPDPCEQIMKNIRATMEESIALDDVLSNRRVKKVGFHLPKWYSPFSGGTFGVIAKEFLEADKAMRDGDDFASTRNWRIYNAARPWEEVAISETELELMKNRIDLEPLVCPQGTIALTAGVDPGQGGFWFTVLAWKKDYSPHLVQYGWLAGDYETSGIDDILREWVYRVDKEERMLHIWRVGIDTGGGQYSTADATMTEAAYLWIRKMRSGNSRIFGTKGMSKDNVRRIRENRLDKMPGDKGAIIPGGLLLIEINTDAMKDSMWFHLRIEEDKPGRFTFNSEVKEDFVKHLLAEQLSMNKNGKWEWILKRRDNHLLDCTVINFAMADSEFRGGIRVVRPTPKPGPSEPPRGGPINPVTQRHRGNWAKGW
jgi:phage terminase large subunit GpA-like protein